MSFRDEEEARARIAESVLAEASRSRRAWPAYHSAHECYGVLAEEVAEFFDIVRQKESDRDYSALRREMIQIAAVAIRGAVEL